MFLGPTRALTGTTDEFKKEKKNSKLTKDKCTMHDTFQLQKALDADEETRRFQPKVIATDQLPDKLPQRFLFILNTDPTHKEGKHWVLAFRRSESKRPVFFDSYGMLPSKYYKGWQKLDSFQCSTDDFQQLETTVCGDHCLYVGKRLAAGHSLDKILKSYSKDDQKHNDEKVFLLIHSRFKFLNRTDHGRIQRKKFKPYFQICLP